MRKIVMNVAFLVAPRKVSCSSPAGIDQNVYTCIFIQYIDTSSLRIERTTDEYTIFENLYESISEENRAHVDVRGRERVGSRSCEAGILTYANEIIRR